MLVLLNDWIDQEALGETWHEITGDSYIVDVRKVKKSKELGYAKAAAEVCKYALKFSDLTVEKTWEAFKTLKGKNLSGSFGSLRGVKIPKNLADDMPEDQDLPYLEMLYKFVFGKHSYYDLVMTRQVEPHSKDNDDEEELRQRGEGGRSDLAITDEARTLPVRGHAVTERPQRGRKKAHWRIPPKTRVRVRQRIRRWDGIMYNIDLFLMSSIGYWLSLVSLFLEKRVSVHSEKLTTFEKSVVSTLSPVAERVSTSDDSEIRISKPSFP